MGPELIPVLLSAGGAAASLMGQQQAADDRRTTMNRQMERTDQATKKAIGMVQNEGQRFNQQSRLDGLQEQENKVYDQTQADIAGAGGASVDTSQGAGAVSKDFLTGKAERAVEEGTRLSSIARAAAKTRAAGGLMGEDGLSRANLAGGLQNVWGTNTNMARANSLDSQSIEEPGYAALGSIASAIAPAMGGDFGKSLGSRIKYSGTSMSPSAPNYVNSMDSGIRW